MKPIEPKLNSGKQLRMKKKMASKSRCI